MDLRNLKSVWKEIGFRPDRSLGQNFLIDKNVRKKILDNLRLKGDETVLEIGPGFGMMTFELAGSAGELIAVEKDRRICSVMRPFFKDAGNIRLVNGDIMKTDIAGLIGGRASRVVVYGNVPYYISTPIIGKVIEEGKGVDSFFVVIQEELADRLTAPPGSRTYGSVSCYVQYHTKPRKVMRVKKNCFYPVPKVDSALLEMELVPEKTVKPADPQLMFLIIRKAFSQRRKKLVNPLSGGGIRGIDKKGWIQILQGAGLDPSSRAEDLSLSDYAAISDIVHEGAVR
ncbi:MAG: ribosomal RNA small subunit methyltransferase A [Candidatus Omnitrophica bacterium]|nr:ribosomal RNA small subunit methyltransferase A [Candidatus Omnitrophota bacterium]